MIAQIEHIALTRVFRVRKMKKKKQHACPATTQYWFLKADLKTVTVDSGGQTLVSGGAKFTEH